MNDKIPDKSAVGRFKPLLEKKWTSSREKQDKLLDRVRRKRCRTTLRGIHQRTLSKYTTDESNPHKSDEVKDKFTFSCPICNMSGFYSTLEEANKQKQKHESGDHSLG
jgi:hexokinase